MKQTKHVLCVDDNPQICEVIAQLLSAAEVRSAGSVAAALAVAAERRFDLFILDIYLPDGVGTDLLATLRKDHPETPAVFITTSPDFTKEAAIEAGAVDLINKVSGNFVRNLLDISKTLLEK